MESILLKVQLTPGLLESATQEVLEAIDRIHKVPGLTPFDVRWTQTVNPSARFRPPADNSLARIDLSEVGNTPRLSFLHEVGHLLDHHLGGGRGYYATATGRTSLVSVIGAAQQSFAYNELYNAAEFLPGWQRSFIRGYLLAPEELWARAYAQFITIRSSHTILLRELNSVRGEQDYNQYRQWSDSDFALISAQIQQSIQDLGWTL